MMMVSSKTFSSLQFFTLLYLFTVTFASTDEATALLKWKATFKNQNNSLLASWTPSSNTCEDWYGIVCFNGRVNRLNIINSRVIGNLYAFPFSSLPFLENLNLSMNNFSGTIPPEISNLTNLVYLDLNSNHISGTIPQQIGSLAKLQILRIFDNHLNGSIPEQIGYLRSLTKLSLGMNFFTGSIPASLGNLSNFSFLLLYENQLSGSIPEEIGHLRSLSILHLSNNSLNGSIPASLGKLKNLSILILFYNHLSGTIPEEIGNLRSLTKLSLGRNFLSGSIPASLGNLTNLSNLVLFYNNLSGAIPEEIGNGYFGDPKFRSHIFKNLSDVQYPSTEPVGPHVQNGPFSRSNDPQRSQILPRCPLIPYLWSKLALTAKTAHFQGQIIPGADLTYGAQFLTQNAHFQGQTILGSQLALTAKKARCQRQTIPGAGKPTILPILNAIVHGFLYPQFALAFKDYLKVPLTLPTGAAGPHVQNNPFSRSNDPRSRTLPVEPVGPHGQNGQFSRSNDPRSKFLVIWNFDLIFAKILPGRPLGPCLWNQLALMSMKFLVIQNSDLIFAKNLPGHPFIPYLCSQLALMAKTTHYQCQTIPGADKRLILPIFECYIFGIFRDLEFRPQFCQKFTWTSINTLPIDLVSPHGENNLFSWSNCHRSRPYQWCQLTLTAKTAYFHGQTIPGVDLTYGPSWPSRPKRPIFKVKRSPKQSMEFLMIQTSDLIFANILPGRPLRPYLWNQLALTAKMAHFQGQMIPGADLTYGASWPSRPKRPICKPKRPILKVKRSPEQPVGPHGQNDPFSRSNDPRSSWPLRPKWPILKVKRSPEQAIEFLKIQNFDRIFSKFLSVCSLIPYQLSQLALTSKTADFQGQTIPGAEFRPHFSQILPGRPLIPYLWSKLALTAKTAHFQGQTIPRAGHGFFLEIRNSDLIFSKIILGHPLRPYLWSQLALTAKTPHFQGQPILEADLTYGVSWPSRPKWSCFKVKRSLEQSMEFLVIQNSDIIFAKILPGPSWPSQPKRPVVNVKRSPELNSNLVYPKRLPKRLLKHYLRSQLALTSKTTHFLGQTIPGAGHYLWNQLALTAKTAHFQGQTIPEAINGIFGDLDSDLNFTKILPRRPLRPYLWCQLTLTAKTAYFHGQMVPGVVIEAGKPPFCQFSCTIFCGFFGDLEFRPHFCQKFALTSVNTLTMEPVGFHNQNGPFSRSNDPRNLTYGAIWPSRPKQPILKVKRSPEPDITYGVSCPTRPKRPIFKIKRSLEHDLTYGASWSSRPKRPIFKVKRSPKQSMEFLLIQNSDLIFANILPGRPLRPYLWSQLASMDFLVIWNSDLIFPNILPGRPLIPYLWNQLALTAKTTHFLDQTIPRAGKSPFYQFSWPSPPKQPIFMVKRSPEQSLPMEPVSPHGQNNPFSGLNNPRSRSLPGRLLRPYLWRQLALTAKTAYFQGQMIPRAVHGIFGNPEFRPHFWQKFTWTFVKTLPMEPVGPYGQNGPFLRSNDPRSRYPSRTKIPIFKVKGSPEQTFDMELVGHHSQNGIYKVKRTPKQSMGFYGDLEFHRHFCQKFTWPSVKTLDMITVVHHCQNFPFTRSNDPRSRIPTSFLPKIYLDLCKSLSMEPVGHHGHTTQLHGQMNPGAVHENFWLPSLSPWPKRPIYKVKRSPEQTLVMEIVGQHSQNGPFTRSNDPRNSYGANWLPRLKRTIYKVKQSPKQSTRFYGDPEFRCHFCQKFTWTSIKTLVMEPVGHHDQNGKFTKSNDPQISYGVNWSPWPKRPIYKEFMVTQNSDVIFAKNLHGPLLRPYLWSQLFAIAKSAHLQGQTIPEAGKPPVLLIFVCYSPREFMVTQNSKIIFAKNMHGPPLRHFIWSQLATMAKTAHLQGQTIPVAEFRYHLSQKFTKSSINTLAMDPVGHHCQNGPFTRSNEPGADLSYGTSWSPRSKRFIYKVKRTPEQSMRFYGDREFQRHVCQKITWASVKTLAMEPVGHHGPNVPFSSWSAQPKWRIYKVNRVPEKSMRFYGHPEFRCHFCKKFTWTSIKTLVMDPVGHHYQNGPFTWSNEPRSRIPMSCLPKIYMELLYDLRYGASWSLRPKLPIYNVKRAPKQLWSYLVTRAKRTHLKDQTIPEETSIKTLVMEPVGHHDQNSQLQGQTSPKAGKPSILTNFICYSPQDFMVTQNSSVIFAKNLHGLSLRPLILSQLVTTSKTANLQTQMIPRADMEPVGHHGQKDQFTRSNKPTKDLRYKANLSPCQKWPIYNVKQSPEQSSIKILVIEPVGHHNQNGPFTRSNDPWSRYGASWSTQPKQPIYKVKRFPKQTLAMEPLGHHNKTAHFEGQTSPGADLSYGTSWLPRPKRSIYKVKRALDYRASSSARPKRPIYKVKRSPKQSMRFYGDKEFRRHFCQKFTWTFIKTLYMEIVGHHGQNSPFIRSNEPQRSWSSRPKRPIYKVKQTPKQTLVVEPVGHHDQNGSFTMSNETRSSSRDFMVTQNSNVIFAKYLHGQPLRPYLRIELVTMEKRPIYKVKQSPKQFMIFYGDPKFRCRFCQKNYVDLRKSLSMEPVGHHGHTTHLQGQTCSGADLSYRSSWSTWPKRPIYKDKLTPEQSWTPRPKRPIYNVKRAPEQLFIIAKSAHLQGQTIPEAGKPPILSIFVCYSPREFMVTHNSDVIFAKNLHGPPLTPYLWNQLVTMAKSAHLQGLTIPGANLNYGASWPPRPKRPIYKNSDVIFAKNLHGPPLRHLLGSQLIWSQLVTTAKTAHLQGQTIPGAGKPSILQIFVCYRSRNFMGTQNSNVIFAKNLHGTPQVLSNGANLSPWPKRPIYKVKRTPKQSTGFHGDPEFRCHFCQKFTLTSIKTLVMVPVEHHGQNGPFTRSNEPQGNHRASWSPRSKQPIYKVKRSPVSSANKNGLRADLHTRKGVTMHPKGFKLSKTKTECLEYTFNDLSHEAYMDVRLDTQFIPNRVGWMKWRLTSSILYDKNVSPRLKDESTSDEDIKVDVWRKVIQDKVGVVHVEDKMRERKMKWFEHSTGFHGDPEFRCHFCQKFTLTSIKTLVMVPVEHHGQNGPFTRSNEPQGNRVNARLEVRRQILEPKGFKLSKTKNECLEYTFNDLSHEAYMDVRLDTQFIPNRVMGDWQKVTRRIEVGWMKWRLTSSILYDKNMSPRLKDESTSDEDIKVDVWRKVIQDKVGVVHVEDKMRERKMKWFEHVKMRCAKALIRRCGRLYVVGLRRSIEMR
ncbi:hypothetical protein H5410_029682 [Solanum commersonii]|uniref:Leucine-rich repeat-containing N-terminal plant-type domain-containing protein n=1 Tax=Solanum commersonii TaxID=4109 RepID=A0A9J5YFA8_SOLCO|nr:hypothetical protein H5410_029682 [Solanum commersonii]